MPDISQELEIIAHEPKGRLVKDAIHDALDKINQTANRRPTAKIGIPINEVIIDTGWISDYIIGRIGEGEIREFDGVVSEGALISGYTYSARAQLNVSDPARVFLVVLYNSTELPELTNIADDVEWSLVDTYGLTTRSFDVNKSEFHALYPDAVLRGYVYSQSELPALSTADIDDVYVDNAQRRLYICAESQSEKVWTEMFIPSGWLDETLLGPVAAIWTATLSEDVSIDVKAEVVSTRVDPDFISAGLFAVYDHGDFSATTLPYHISLFGYGTKAFDNELKQHFKGRVTAVSDLPEQQVYDGDIYYVSDEESCYTRYTEDGESGWRKTFLYDSYDDSVTETGDEDGIHPRTSRIFISAGYNVNSIQAWPHLSVDDLQETPLTPVAYPMAGGSHMSAWHQEHGSINYPVFKYCTGDENYINLYDGSVAMLVIEIGDTIGGEEQ